MFDPMQECVIDHSRVTVTRVVFDGLADNRAQDEELRRAYLGR